MQRLPAEFHDTPFAYACACSVDSELAQQGMAMLSQIVNFNQDLGDWPRMVNAIGKLWGSKLVNSFVNLVEDVFEALGGPFPIEDPDARHSVELRLPQYFDNLF